MKSGLPPVQYESIRLAGGLDLITPLANLKNGVVRSAINFECSATGGYTRIAGYERFDGRPLPSAATYAVFTVSGNTLPAAGQTITGSISGATAFLLALTSDTFVVTAVTGSFTGSEPLTASGVTVATMTGTTGPASQKQDAEYQALAADYYRQFISAPPGSGPLRGAFLYNGTTFCVRDNAGATAAVLHKATPSGWQAVAFGYELAIAPRAATVTMTIATPGVISWTGHGLANGAKVAFTTTGSLPTGLTPSAVYYVVSAAANTFSVAATPGGAAIATSGSQSGTHTCTAYTVQIQDAVTVTGLTSGATAVVARSVLQSGAWDAVNTSGRLIFNAITGTFAAGEALRVGGVTYAQAAGAAASIAWQPGGTLETRIANFAGQASSLRVYGVDGKNRGWEFDGTTLVPITTGEATDKPTHLEIHKKHLFFSFGSSIIHSAPGLPYAWSAQDGSSEIATGDTVTGMLELPGNQTTGAMAVFNQTTTNMLYGTSVSNWNFVPYNTGTGCFPFACQNLSQAFMFDSRGIYQINASLNYGNFDQSSLTANIRPFIEAHRANVSGSVLCRAKSQYRAFFSDGFGLFMTIVDDHFVGSMPVQFPIAGGVYNTWAGIDPAGNEVIYYCGADGMLYRGESGTSFDGQAIFSGITLIYDSVRSPRVLKRYRKAAVEMLGSSYAEVYFSYSLGYGKAEYDASLPSTNGAAMAVSNWDTGEWESFTWDGSPYAPVECEMTGTAENVALTFSSNSTAAQPFTINSVVVHFTPRRGLR